MNHEIFMRRAIALALNGYGQTSPNPIVGALILKNTRIIAEGYHKKAGFPHAEINAIKKAGPKAKGADLYVTLEPCCHFGKTPPCTDTIVKAGIKRVIYGMKDPNPRVAGQGLKKLKSAGIKTIGPVMEDACNKLNRPFIKWIKTGMPYVTAKIAITLDGKIADAKGCSKWISNRLARTYAHILRAGSDIVMVGAETARKDRPKLNVRLPGYNGKQPLPLIITSKNGRKVNLEKLLKELGGAGFQSILVEGGGKLHTELFKKGLIDSLVVFISPKIFGSKARQWLQKVGNSSANNPLRITPEHVFTLGEDIVLEGIIK